MSAKGPAQNDSNSTLMHSPPSPKAAHMDTITLSATAVAGVGAASVLKDTANLLQASSLIGGRNGGDACSRQGHKKSTVDMNLISQQICDLSQRMDTLESSVKTDIRTILEILQQQQQQSHSQYHPGGMATSRSVPRINQHAPAVPERQLTNVAYQADSEYSSFDLGCGGGVGPEKVLPHQSSLSTTTNTSHAGPIPVAASGGNSSVMKLTTPKQRGGGGGNVQRSISQPECANERNLFT